MKQKLANLMLQLLGWSKHGSAPQDRRCVLIAAPHTSNWDFPLLILFASAYGLKVNWFAKKSLFNPLIGWLMCALGGVPVNRKSSQNLVAQMAQEFSSKAQFLLIVPTEATRSRTEYWKSGFYHIARQARVQIVPTYLDYAQKRGGFGVGLKPGNSVAADMQYLRDFYKDKTGLYPENFGPVRLKDVHDAD